MNSLFQHAWTSLSTTMFKLASSTMSSSLSTTIFKLISSTMFKPVNNHVEAGQLNPVHNHVQACQPCSSWPDQPCSSWSTQPCASWPTQPCSTGQQTKTSCVFLRVYMWQIQTKRWWMQIVCFKFIIIINISLDGFGDNTGMHFTRSLHFLRNTREIPARILSQKPFKQ